MDFGTGLSIAAIVFVVLYVVTVGCLLFCAALEWLFECINDKINSAPYMCQECGHVLTADEDPADRCSVCGGC